MTTILSLLMAVAYIAAVIIKDKKQPDSISALVYALLTVSTASLFTL